jgi:hypothetical protein
MNHVSIDIETMDTVPGGAILSIGAIEFDPIRGTVGRRFHEIINFDSCLKHGFTWSSDTKAWWDRQSPEARVTLDRAMNDQGLPVREVLHAFGVWLEGLQHDGTAHTCVWGNGNAFDNAFLAVAYARVGLKYPWPFWNDRCLRTLKGLFAPDSVELPIRSGVYHNALDDAAHQARCVIVYLQALQNLSKLAAPPSALDGRRVEREATGRMVRPSATSWTAAELMGAGQLVASQSPVGNDKRWPICTRCSLPLIPTSTGLVCENGHSGD